MADVRPGVFGVLLRQWRERRALTQEELAARAGLTVNAIGGLERGVRRRPYPHTVRALADGLGLTEAEFQELAASVAAPAVPPPASRLIGRDEEAAAILGLLSARRLVTLTGPGGVGKTSLALDVVARAAGQFPHGHVVVELAAVRDPARPRDSARLRDSAGVLEEAARRLGVPERRPGPLLDALAAHLAGRRLLLVLDNLEHLPGAADAVAALVAACPDLVVLATSRSPLRIRAEHEVVVEPLEGPDAWALDDPAGVAGAPAVAMFLDRAAAMGAPLTVTADNAPTIAAICWRLDGLPLALELAAARARLLEPAALLERLDEAMSAGALRDLPERQQTVRDTVDWSHDLLDADQRRLFARLAAFRAPFTVEAAEAVGGTGLAGLTALVEQSLLTRVPPGADGRTRLRMLGPIRQYARQRLAASPDAAPTADRHAEHFLAESLGAAGDLRGPGLIGRLDGLERSHADLAAAAEHLLAAGRAAEVAAMVWAVWPYLALRAHATEALGWLGPALSSGGSGSPALAASGVLSYVLGDLDRARADTATALRAGASVETAAFAGLAAVFVGDGPGARRIVAEVAEPDGADPAGRWAWALLLGVRAQIAILAADLATAGRRLEEAERVARGTDNAFAIALVLNMRATVAEAGGDLPATAGLLAESVTRSAAAGSRWTLAYALPALAAAAHRLGAPRAAAVLLGAAATV
ncbi:helix-turn-helix domain-containing protein, partial [Dactylosporangium sp. NPDC051485]|uniref:ATP-binding protein n=1 Tax=Dactylosporangium sp. NPDC051485 TaxID=3154846 RepID=UPI00344AABEE